MFYIDISLFPYNFIFLFIIAVLFLFFCVILNKRNLITGKHIISMVCFCIIVYYIVCVQIQFINLKQNIQNNTNDIKFLQEHVVFDMPVYSVVNGELLRPYIPIKMLQN